MPHLYYAHHFHRGSHRSALAQSVEQMTVNHWVAGSSPAGGAKFNEKGRMNMRPFLCVQKMCVSKKPVGSINYSNSLAEILHV